MKSGERRFKRFGCRTKSGRGAPLIVRGRAGAGLLLAAALSAACGGKIEGDAQDADRSSEDSSQGGSLGTAASLGDGGSAVGTGRVLALGGAASAGGASSAGGEGGDAVGGSGASADGVGGNPLDCVPGIPEQGYSPELLSLEEYDNVMRDLLFVTTLVSADDGPPSSLIDLGLYIGPMDDEWDQYVTAAELIAAEVMAGPNSSMFITCDPVIEDCFEETIRRFGRRAFRRPLSDDEVEAFLSITTTSADETPSQVAEAILVAFISSPSFIQRIEVGGEAEGDAFRLSDHEIASRLSFMFWGSIPDEELNAAADAGALSNKAQILAQAERMMQNREKFGPQVAAAHRAYVEMESYSHWWSTEHETEDFPDYTAAALPIMKAEVDAFFEELVLEGGSFRDLFLSPAAFVNEETAALYDLELADFGEALIRVELDSNQRPGFLTRIGFLSSFSGRKVSDPILRGAFITVNLLGVDPGSPDGGPVFTPIPPGEYMTQREAIEALNSPVSCNGCHGPYIDPPGFVLENYNAVGSWQTVDARGGEIDSVAEVAFYDEDRRTISTPLELMQQIADHPPARRIYSERLVTFTTGRLPNEEDRCLVEQLSFKLGQDGYTIRDFFLDLTQVDSFRLLGEEH